MPYPHEEMPRMSASLRKKLCGGWFPEESQEYWQKFGDRHAKFFIAGADKPPEDTVALWVPLKKISGKLAGLISQPTGDCVSRGFEAGLEMLQANMILGGLNKRWVDIYPPFHYATGRVLVGKNRLRGGAGSICGWQAQALERYGSLEYVKGLPVYSGKNVDAWGDDRKASGQSFRDHMEQASQHLLRTSALVDSMQELFMALSSGYPIPICSNRGYTMKPGRDGYHKASGNWAHCMLIAGYSISEDWVAIANSWGDVHGVVEWSGGKMPPGYIKVRLEEFARMHLRSSEAIALSNYAGFPQRRIKARNGYYTVQSKVKPSKILVS